MTCEYRLHRAILAHRILSIVAFFLIAVIVLAATGVAQQPTTVQRSITSSGESWSSSSREAPVRLGNADHPRTGASRFTNGATRNASGVAAEVPLFLPPVGYSTGGSPQGVTIADVNGDGKPDLIVANFGGENLAGVISDGSVAVLLGNGDGTFQSAVDYDSGGVWTYFVVAGDLTGDGKIDLVAVSSCASGTYGVSCSPHGVVGVLLGRGDGTFQSATVYDSGGYGANSAAIADVNGDGIPDLVVTNSCRQVVNNSCAGKGIVSVLLGNGDGTFQPAVTHSSGAYGANSVVVADVNGDGHPDLVVSNCGNSSTNCTVTSPPDGAIGVLLGNGDGTFQRPVLYDAGGPTTMAVAVADVNGDGKPDLLTADCGPLQCAPGNPAGVVGVLLGNGDGTFQKAVDYAASISPDSLALADVIMDGKPDIVVGNWGWSGEVGAVNAGSFSVLPGNGDGTFQPAVSFFISYNEVVSIAVADVNGDGKPDVVSTTTGGSVFVSLNNEGTPSETRTALSVSPKRSIYGQDVKLTATLTSNSVPPAGMVNFYDGSVLIGSAALNNSSATLEFQPAAGSHSITAAYQGSSSLQGSTSSPVILFVDIARSSTAVSSSANPAARGKSLTFTAFVTSQYGGAVSGSVMFTNGSQTLGTAVLPYATLTTSFSTDGSNSIVATYSGDASNRGSTSMPLTQYVDSDTSKTTLTTSGSPSMVGQPVTFTATVTSKYGTIPNGEFVTFTTLGSFVSAALTDGVATFTTSSLSGGRTHIIEARYPGDPTFLPSWDTAKQVVDLYSTTTALSSSLNPSNYGQAVTFTATVESTGPDTPTGNVELKDGTKVLKWATLSAGVATLTISDLAVGTHSLTVVYGGDSESAKSTSPVLNQVVN